MQDTANGLLGFRLILLKLNIICFIGELKNNRKYGEIETNNFRNDLVFLAHFPEQKKIFRYFHFPFISTSIFLFKFSKRSAIKENDDKKIVSYMHVLLSFFLFYKSFSLVDT